MPKSSLILVLGLLAQLEIMGSGSQQSALDKVASALSKNEQCWSAEVEGVEIEERAQRGAQGGIIMKRQGMRRGR